MYKKHSIDDRFTAVKMVAQGMSPKHVGCKLGIDKDYIAEWYERYRLYGVAGLEKQPYKY